MWGMLPLLSKDRPGWLRWLFDTPRDVFDVFLLARFPPHDLYLWLQQSSNWRMPGPI